MYYNPIGGFQFHDQKTSGSYTYYLYVAKDGRVLVKRAHDTTNEMRYGLSDGLSPTYAEIYADPTVLNYGLISALNL